MCLVSAITDYAMKQWPHPVYYPPGQYQEYLDILEKARKWDELTGQKDCVDPVKDAWNVALKAVMQENSTGAKP